MTLAGRAVDAKYGDNTFADDNASGSGGSSEPQYKVRRPGLSGKEAATDAPSWAKGERPYVNENGKSFAKRLMDNKYGEGKWKASNPEYSQIKKWGDRAFINPK